MSPFGDRAIRFALPARAPRRRLFTELAACTGVRDVVLTEEIGCVVFAGEVDVEAVARVLESAAGASVDEPGATHIVAVVYDGEDLDAVAHAIGRSRDDVIRLHSDAEYRVAMLGFVPGFAYLRGLPDALRLPRRAPRPRVPARSVAIAADYTGIYPFASPGGWHLVGRAPSFEAFAGGHAALAIGDTVRFVPTPEIATQVSPPKGLAPLHERPHLEVTRAAGLGLLVDGGRPGRMHEGVPPGGPLVRSLFARANGLAGNDAAAPAIELAGSFEVVARGGTVTIADDESAVDLADGERHAVSTTGRTRVRYLAVANGGIDAPLVLGGRGALPIAGVGGPLRKGDRLVAASEALLVHEVTSSTVMLGGEPIAIMPGPDAPAGFSFESMLASDLRVATASDRTGTRLEGPSLIDGVDPAAMTRASAPMVMGAIELTPSGLIVLGPDHPTTGGYPVVAVVRSRSLDALFARPIGAPVRFVVA